MVGAVAGLEHHGGRRDLSSELKKVCVAVALDVLHLGTVGRNRHNGKVMFGQIKAEDLPRSCRVECLYDILA